MSRKRAFSSELDHSPTVSIRLASGQQTVTCVSRELLNVVSSLAKGLPADTESWDLSQLQVEGQAVQRETVIAWLHKAYMHIYDECFEDESMMEQPPSKRHQVPPGLQDPEQDGAQQQQQQQQEQQLATKPDPMDPGCCTGLTRLLLFADAVGSSKPLMRACAAVPEEGLQLRVQLAAGPVVMNLRAPFYHVAMKVATIQSNQRASSHAELQSDADKAAFQQQVCTQVEALLYTAYKLQLEQLTEVVHTFIRWNTRFNESILRNRLSAILSPRVLDAAGGYTSLLQSLLLTTMCTEPMAFCHGSFTQHALTPLVDPSMPQPALRFTAEVAADGFAGSRKGERVDIQLDLLNGRLEIGPLGTESAAARHNMDAQLLIGPLPVSRDGQQLLLGPSGAS